MSVLVALQGQAHARNVGESLEGGGFPLLLGSGGVSETVTRQVAVVRTASDSVGSISESPSRVVGALRSTSDSIAAISETVTRLVTVLRSTSDAIASLSESVVRIVGALRSSSAVVDAITEGTGEDTVEARSVADTLDEPAGGFPLLFGGLPGISEAVDAVYTPHVQQDLTRTAGDSISAITESVAYPRGPQGEVIELPLHKRVPRERREPVQHARYASDSVSSLHEQVASTTTVSDEWLVLDLVEVG